MASMRVHPVVLLLLGVAVPLLFSPAEAGEIGVNYGRVGNDLPDPASVVQLLKENGITMVRVFDANRTVLMSLANTGIKVVVMIPNENLAAAAADASYALRWVRRNVAAYYPTTKIHGVAVGNEVFDSRPDLTQQLLPAMTNMHGALEKLGLTDAVKVSTPIAFTAIVDSFPPSAGRFRDDVAESVMKPMLDFLQRTRSYLTFNPYPFFAYADKPDKISLDYALGNSNPGVRDDNTGLMYYSLLDAQLDATYFAMEKLAEHLSIRQQSGNHSHKLEATRKMYVSETGWSSSGSPKRPHGVRSHLVEATDDCQAATVTNAKAYNNNLINRVLSGNTGTPYRPDGDMDIYIFALFNENQKGDGQDDTERYFGLFYPNQTKVYEFDYHGGALAKSWCVANASIGDSWLQAALEYACGHGADCSAIQPGEACFEPNTRLAHASYAFNSYYKRNGRATGTCDFGGAAYIVYDEPDGICDPSLSWCVANAAVGDERLQAALDYACNNGADCRAIQPSGDCFEPNNRVAHALYAFNSYHQRKGRASGTCDFAGAASVVYQAPKIGKCVLPSKAWWIVETTAKSAAYAAI